MIGMKESLSAAIDNLAKEKYLEALSELEVTVNVAERAGAKIPKEVQKLKQVAQRLRDKSIEDENLTGAILAVEQKNYLLAARSLEQIANYAGQTSSGFKVSEETKILGRVVLELGVNECLTEAKEALSKRNYLRAHDRLTGAELFYMERNGVDTSSEIYNSLNIKLTFAKKEVNTQLREAQKKAR